MTTFMKENIACISLIALIFFLSCVGPMLLDKNEQHEFQSITVTEGDTLWEIASSYQGSIATREVINLIKMENNITNDIIQAGQVLRVPIIQLTEKEVVYATSEERR